MSIFNRKPTTEQQVRGAEEALEAAKRDRGQTTYRAQQLAGERGAGAYRPCDDAGDVAILEKTVELADAQSAYDAAHPDAAKLREATRSALIDLEAQLSAVVDPPAPTLASTEEAIAAYEAEVVAHKAELAANTERRREIGAACTVQLAAKLAANPDGANFVSYVSTALNDAESRLGEVTDPATPEPGAPTPENVAALTRALNAHRAAIAANEKRRNDIRYDFLTVVQALKQAYQRLNAKQREAGLPSVNVFGGSASSPVAGYSPRFDLLEQSVGELCPQAIGMWIRVIGSAQVSSEAARFKLAEIRARHRAYEQAQQAKAAKADLRARGIAS